MKDHDLDKLRYPAGKFIAPDQFTNEGRAKCRIALQEMPAAIMEATKGLSEEQLDIPYRDKGWSTRQIVHHLADSHINSFVRFKLALTEDNPQIKAYDQDEWAKGTDASLPIDSSIKILEGVHIRLVNLLENMTEDDYNRTLFHPEWKKNLSLDFMTALYGWHSVHHLTQIQQLRERKGW